MKSDIISKLVTHAGTYEGTGINHEGQRFKGTLTLAAVLGGKGATIQFKATGENDAVFHEEYTMVTPTMSGVGLFNLNTNVPGLVPHELIRHESTEDGADRATFGFGDRANTKAFREEITIELHPEGEVSYRFAWGMPGGEFADRSGVVMRPI